MDNFTYRLSLTGLTGYGEEEVETERKFEGRSNRTGLGDVGKKMNSKKV